MAMLPVYPSSVLWWAMACLPSHNCELLQDLAASAAVLVGIAQLLMPTVGFFTDM